MKVSMLHVVLVIAVSFIALDTYQHSKAPEVDKRVSTELTPITDKDLIVSLYDEVPGLVWCSLSQASKSGKSLIVAICPKAPDPDPDGPTKFEPEDLAKYQRGL